MSDQTSSGENDRTMTDETVDRLSLESAKPESGVASPVRSAERTGPLVEIHLDQPLSRAIDELERKFIEHALSASNGRIADAAQLLGLSRKGLFLKRRRWGLVGTDES